MHSVLFNLNRKKLPCYALGTFGNELSIQKQLILYKIKSVNYVEFPRVYNLLYLKFVLP